MDSIVAMFNGEVISILLFFVGFCGLIVQRNMIKTIISLGIMQAAIILYFLSASFIAGSVPPIGVGAQSASAIADPLPQALMITEIVIGVGVTAVALTLFIHLYHQYGTTDWIKAKARRMKQQ